MLSRRIHFEAIGFGARALNFLSRQINSQARSRGDRHQLKKAFHFFTRRNNRQDAVLETIADKNVGIFAAITHFIPKPRSAHGACSRLGPQPKLSSAIRIAAPHHGVRFRMNCGFVRRLATVRHRGRREKSFLGNGLVGSDRCRYLKVLRARQLRRGSIKGVTARICRR